MADLRVPDTNHMIIAGRLTRDPELKYTQSSKAVCNLAIANTKYYRKQDGTNGEQTVFVDVAIWGDPAERIAEYGKKGMAVQAEGRLTQDNWEDQTTGQKRSRLKMTAQRVVPLEWKESKGQPQPANATAAARTGGNGNGGQSPMDGPPQFPEDDIPF